MSSLATAVALDTQGANRFRVNSVPGTAVSRLLYDNNVLYRYLILEGICTYGTAVDLNPTKYNANNQEDRKTNAH